MLSAATVLNAWETGLAENPVRRALTLLSLLWPEAASQELAEMSIGRRDWYLFRLREYLFGTGMEALVPCPQCGERLELALNSVELRGIHEPSAENASVLALADGKQLHYRLPNSNDLLALETGPGAEEARRQLLARCVLDDVPEAELMMDALDALGSQLEQVDPAADIRLDLRCPACGHSWLESFDIASFLWNEINGWALRTLRQVHLLASA